MTNYFNVGAFFVLFRESVEAAVILSVLLAFVDRSVDDNETQKSLKKQVWWGTLAGIVISLIIGVSLTVTFYVLGKDVFGDAEPLWEGILQSLAVILLTWLAFRMLQVNSLIAKWEGKIQNHLNERNMMEKGIPYFSNAYSLFILAFTVVIREGLEAVIFIAGVCYYYFEKVGWTSGSSFSNYTFYCWIIYRVNSWIRIIQGIFKSESWFIL